MGSAVPPLHLAHPLSGHPGRGVLLRWGSVVLALHLVLLLSTTGTLDWQLKSSPLLPTGPLQTRTIPAVQTDILAEQRNSPAKTAITSTRTRIAIENVKPRPAPGTNKDTGRPSSLTPSPKAISPPEIRTGTAELMPNPETATTTAPEPGGPVATETNAPSPTAKGPHSGVLAEPQPSPDKTPSPDGKLPATSARPPNAEATGKADPAPLTSPMPSALPAETAVDAPANPVTATSPDPASALTPSPPPTPTAPLARATLELPSLPLAAIPPSALLSYRLQGQEKGLNYSASGELRWQRNDSAYAMSLSVKALLLGSRHWRSQGLVTPEGLAPVKYSDSWRSERVAHFDRPNHRIVFSSNAPTVALQAGAQDQVSLYVQLAAAMAQQNTPLPVGTRLQIQTVTVRDALPWLLTLEKTETLQLNGSPLQTTLWICQPRNRFDARVEFWVAAEHDWLPARIRITQTTGSFIDLQLTGRSALPDLPQAQPPG